MSNWIKTLSTVAPVLASALGGPLGGAMAQVAINVAGNALGIDKATQEDIAAAVKGGDPETLFKLKTAENQFLLDMERLGVDVKRIDAADRDSARQLGIAKGLAPQICLSIVFVAGYFLVLDMLVDLIKAGTEINDVHMVLLSTLFGVLTAGVVQVMNYWFGSSSGSKQKTDLMGSK